MHASVRHVPRGPGLHRHPLTWVAAIALLIAIALLVQHDVVQTSDLSSTVTGSGIASTATRRVAPFTGVELAGGNDVSIRAGATQSVTVHGDDNLLELVTTDVRGGRLVITSDTSFSTVSPMWAQITVPTLDTIALSGSGQVTVDGIDMERLTVDLGGSGVVRGQGRRVAQVEAALTGSGSIELQPLLARDADVVVSGSGQIMVHATRSLDARVPGTGAVMYVGNPPHVTADVSGSGTVQAA